MRSFSHSSPVAVWRSSQAATIRHARSARECLEGGGCPVARGRAHRQPVQPRDGDERLRSAVRVPEAGLDGCPRRISRSSSGGEAATPARRQRRARLRRAGSFRPPRERKLGELSGSAAARGRAINGLLNYSAAVGVCDPGVLPVPELRVAVRMAPAGLGFSAAQARRGPRARVSNACVTGGFRTSGIARVWGPRTQRTSPLFFLGPRDRPRATAIGRAVVAGRCGVSPESKKRRSPWRSPINVVSSSSS